MQLLFAGLVLCSLLAPGQQPTLQPVAAYPRVVDDWLDYVVGDLDETETVTLNTLTLYEIGEMRVRDIKRRLQRFHGYGADEVGRMLDKKELINTLAFEEHKTRERRIDKQKRHLLKRGIIGALVAVAVVMCWPLLSHAWEVAWVNFVVFTDRKWLEGTRCYELQSIPGFFGIVCMAIVDILQFWLSASVLLSWVMTSKYFFPIPNLAIRPAQFMGGQVASGPMAKYGFNVGPMAISWLFRFLNGKLELWTGKALATAQRQQRAQERANREHETPWEKEERKARKAARRAARQAAKEEAEVAAAAEAARRPPPPGPQGDMPGNGSPLFPTQEKEKPTYETASVEQFLQEEFHSSPPDSGIGDPSEEADASGFDELD